MEMFAICIVSGMIISFLYFSDFIIRSIILYFVFREKLLHLGVEQNGSGPVNSQVDIIFLSVFALSLCI